MKSNADTTQQQPQRQTAQEAIAANVKALIEQLEHGRSETLTGYLSAMARFHNYSFGNILSIAHHRPEEFATLVHELAHEMLHRAERRAATTKTVRETEAEAVAFIVSRAVGLNTGSASADYISLYAGSAELLTESLAVIQQASAAILDALFAEEAEQLAQAS